MADNEPITPDTWGSPQLRRGILAKIQETLNSFGVTTNKSPAELERSVFQKATSKEQYLSFVARLIIHLKNNARPGLAQGPGVAQGQQGAPQQQQQPQHSQLASLMQQTGPGTGPPQLNMMQQQQQNNQMHAQQMLQQQQQLQAQMKLGQGSGMANSMQPMQAQGQMMPKPMGNMAGGGAAGPNGPKMNPMMMNSNPGGSDQMGQNEQMVNMMGMKGKPMNPHLGPNSISIVNNSSFNPQMNNTNVNNTMANMSSNLNSVGPGGALGQQSSTATSIVTSILNSGQPRPSLMMTPNANSGPQLATTHVTLNPQPTPGQLGPGGQPTMALQQQRMVNATMMPNGRMIINQGIRPGQQPVNMTPNLQAQLRLRGVAPGGPNAMQQITGIQQTQPGGGGGPIPIYLQQQPPPNQQQLPPGQGSGPNLGPGQGAPGQFEISNQRLTPVTVTGGQQFRPMMQTTNNGPGANFVQSFNPNLGPGQTQQIVVSNAATLATGPPPGINVQGGAGPNAGMMPGNLPGVPSPMGGNKMGPTGPMSGPPTASPVQIQTQMQGNKLLAANSMLSGPNMNIHSPSNFHVASPASVQSIPMMASPAGRAASTIGAPSPQSALNTPASPGQAHTPAGQKMPPLPKDPEQLYMEKLASMQKYLDPLRNLINHLENAEGKYKEYDRLKNLYSILVNERRVTFDFLEKCEKALEKMDKDQRFGMHNRFKTAGGVEISPAMPSIPSIPTQPGVGLAAAGSGAAAGPVPPQPAAVSGAGAATTGSSKIQDICQPLIDAVLKHCDKPMFSHTLARTFGPALAVLHHEPYQPNARVNLTGNFVYYSNTTTTTPTPKNVFKRKESPIERETTILNDVLQGEIARLDIRFNVRPLVSSKRFGVARSQHLLCRLDDHNLPCVPPITVYIPDSYPDIPPHYNLDRTDYENSPFFTKLYDLFAQNLLKLQGAYSLTSLLLTWEQSVRQAVCLNLKEINEDASIVEEKENVRVQTPKVQMVM